MLKSYFLAGPSSIHALRLFSLLQDDNRKGKRQAESGFECGIRSFRMIGDGDQESVIHEAKTRHDQWPAVN